MNNSISHNQKHQMQFAPFRLAVRADVTRIYSHFSWGLLIRSIVFVRTFRPVFTMRLCQAVYSFPQPLNWIILLPCKLLHYLAQQLAGMDLGWDTQVGPGFLINHGWGLVVGSHDPGLMIGSNVTIFHGVTIGMKHNITDDGRVKLLPIIEDEVWIGPNATIIGNVVIGRGSRIAPGTIVSGNVEPYSIVAGNPKRVIKTGATPDVINPAVFDYQNPNNSK